MQNGFYRLQYKSDTLTTIGVIVLDNGILSGCDRFYFMRGKYQTGGNRISGTVTFRRHTKRSGMLAIIPALFELVFNGVGSDKFGQIDGYCSAIPLIRGNATFTWLGALNATGPAPAA
jgi:hypothetical protein